MSTRANRELFVFYSQNQKGRGGIPFLVKEYKSGKCHVSWSDGIMSHYELFQRALNGPLGAHMNDQLMDYFNTLNSRSKAEYSSGRYNGYFGPIDCSMASEVFAIVSFHFKTALEWIIESGATREEFTIEAESKWASYIDRKNEEIAKLYRIDQEQKVSSDNPPWVIQPQVEQKEDQHNHQAIAYRIFDLIEPALKLAIAKALEENNE